MTRQFVIALFLVVNAGIALAQNRAQTPWWNSPVVSDIGLSAAQETKIRQIVRSYRDRLFDARNNVQKAEAALDDVLNDQDVNPAAAKPIIERVAVARENSSRVFLAMSIEVRAVITLDQWRELVRRWDEVKTRKFSDIPVPGK
jgi:predicted nucleotide-binding protein